MDKKLSKMIMGRVLEICIAIIFVIVSYFQSVNSPIEASIAMGNSLADGSLQYNYKQADFDAIAYKNVLDFGILSVRNPYKESKNVKINLILYVSDDIIDKLKVTYGDKSIDINSVYVQEGKYKLLLGVNNIMPYKSLNNTLKIEGDIPIGTVFSYDFEVISSMNI